MKTPRLVIIGNGMAGARLAEEVVARRTPRLQPIDITMFGDEPYGNYNRILLSGVLSGSHDPKDIFINPLAWYEEQGVTLHAGARVTRIDRERRCVYAAGDVAAPYDHLVIATGSQRVHSADRRHARRARRAAQRRVRVPHARRLRRDPRARRAA